MTSKHTPGPWKLKLGKGIEYTYLVSDRKGQDIANFAHYPNATKTQTKANARLIAAAPEMLDLHKKHMELMIEIAQELKNPRMPIGQTVEASIRMLALAAKESLDAIAKATGEPI